MKIKYAILTAVIFFSAGFSAQLLAQFQGKIEMKLYSEDDGQTEENTLNMFVTNNRIMLQGEDAFSFGEGMNAEGLLIRNDHKDFVLLMGENRGIQITKTEIEGMIDMFSSWGGQSQNSQNQAAEGPGYRFSDETRTILGKECAEMIIEDEEDPDNYLSIWLTPNIDINWGMLAEPWKNIPQDMKRDFEGVSQDLLFQGKNFPMLIEAHEDGETTKIFEVTNMQESNVAKAMVEIPSGITLLSAKDFIFNMMMQQ